MQYFRAYAGVKTTERAALRSNCVNRSFESPGEASESEARVLLILLRSRNVDIVRR